MALSTQQAQQIASQMKSAGASDAQITTSLQSQDPSIGQYHSEPVPSTTSTQSIPGVTQNGYYNTSPAIKPIESTLYPAHSPEAMLSRGEITTKQYISMTGRIPEHNPETGQQYGQAGYPTRAETLTTEQQISQIELNAQNVLNPSQAGTMNAPPGTQVKIALSPTQGDNGITRYVQVEYGTPEFMYHAGQITMQQYEEMTHEKGLPMKVEVGVGMIREMPVERNILTTITSPLGKQYAIRQTYFGTQEQATTYASEEQQRIAEKIGTGQGWAFSQEFGKEAQAIKNLELTMKTGFWAQKVAAGVPSALIKYEEQKTMQEGQQISTTDNIYNLLTSKPEIGIQAMAQKGAIGVAQIGNIVNKELINPISTNIIDKIPVLSQGIEYVSGELNVPFTQEQYIKQGKTLEYKQQYVNVQMKESAEMQSQKRYITVGGLPMFPVSRLATQYPTRIEVSPMLETTGGALMTAGAIGPTVGPVALAYIPTVKVPVIGSTAGSIIRDAITMAAIGEISETAASSEYIPFRSWDNIQHNLISGAAASIIFRGTGTALQKVTQIGVTEQIGIPIVTQTTKGIVSPGSAYLDWIVPVSSGATSFASYTIASKLQSGERITQEDITKSLVAGALVTGGIITASAIVRPVTTSLTNIYNRIKYQYLTPPQEQLANQRYSIVDKGGKKIVVYQGQEGKEGFVSDMSIPESIKKGLTREGTTGYFTHASLNRELAKSARLGEIELKLSPEQYTGGARAPFGEAGRQTYFAPYQDIPSYNPAMKPGSGKYIGPSGPTGGLGVERIPVTYTGYLGIGERTTGYIDYSGSLGEEKIILKMKTAQNTPKGVFNAIKNMDIEKATKLYFGTPEAKLAPENIAGRSTEAQAVMPPQIIKSDFKGYILYTSESEATGLMKLVSPNKNYLFKVYESETGKLTMKSTSGESIEDFTGPQLKQGGSSGSWTALKSSYLPWAAPIVSSLSKRPSISYGSLQVSVSSVPSKVSVSSSAQSITRYPISESLVSRLSSPPPSPSSVTSPGVSSISSVSEQPSSIVSSVSQSSLSLSRIGLSNISSQSRTISPFLVPTYTSSKRKSRLEEEALKNRLYLVQYKTKGQFITLGKTTYGKALSLGQSQVTHSLSQRFRILPTRETTSEQDVMSNLDTGIFTRPKKSTVPIEFVERRGKTLKRGTGEVGQIQAARKSKGFWNPKGKKP